MTETGAVASIRARLEELAEPEYKAFQERLIPSVEPSRILGVRTPQLRQLARELKGSPEAEAFLAILPHETFDEDQLHSFLLCEDKNFGHCVEEVDRFLPYVNNWATCDQLAPKIFKKNKAALLPHIDRWLASSRVYTVRFGIEMLMSHFLDEDFHVSQPEKVASLRSDEYYLNMMIAWYFATALTKQWDAALPFIEQERLDLWTHNKAIQKAIESKRITEEQKTYLRSLKRKAQ